MNNKQKQAYDAISAEYAKATATDPNKRYVQYPESLRLVGDLRGKSVFDVGCANGMFTRMMKRAGASEVTGFELSQKELDDARYEEAQNPQGIEYISDYSELSVGKRFDIVTAIMVIPAVEPEQLEELFGHAGRLLAEDGVFVALTLNPDFRRFGTVVNCRRFCKRSDGRIDIGFLDETGRTYLTIVDADFSKQDVERAARGAGFTDVCWESLKIDPAGINRYGTEYWAGYEEDCPYIGFTANK